jgi:hypothetical protein
VSRISSAQATAKAKALFGAGAWAARRRGTCAIKRAEGLAIEVLAEASTWEEAFRKAMATNNAGQGVEIIGLSPVQSRSRC